MENQVNYTYTDQQGRQVFLVEENVEAKIFGAIVFSMILPFVGGVIAVYRGYYNIRKDFSMFYRKEMQMQYKPDKRFNTGKRPLGEIEVKITSKGDLVPVQKESNIKKGKAYIFIGIFSVVFYIITLILIS